MLRNKRGRDSERPAHRDEDWPPLAATRESHRTETKTQHSQKLKKKKKKKGLVNLEGTRPSFSVDAICSTYLKNNFVLYGMLLIHGVGLPPKPLPYCRLNHKDRFILRSTWKKTAKAHFTALMAICCLLSCVDHGRSFSLFAEGEKEVGKGKKNTRTNLQKYLKFFH